MRTITETIHHCLSLPPHLASIKLSEAIRELFPDHAILETDDWEFNLNAFLESGQAFADLDDRMHATIRASWINANWPVSHDLQTGLLKIEWREHKLMVLVVNYEDCTKRYAILAESEKVCHAFFRRVCESGDSVNGRILIFNNGHFHVDEALYEELKKCSRADLTYSDHLSQAIEENVFGFFKSKDVYDQYGVPWKRGVLFIGPPGNGKTQTIKAIISESKRACIYVKAFNSETTSISRGIATVFAKARRVAPCLLVMEDIDSLVPRDHLSNLLNELDGFANNHGILVLATTNHPDKLDPALTQRPSRFDRKIYFELPEESVRLEYLKRRNQLRPECARASDEELQLVAVETHGFTFAYLKELELSATMLFSRSIGVKSYFQCLSEMVTPLRKQMKSDAKIPAAKKVDEDE
jgi:SpoVK/Ycf46/Vps4 family AAA+-type ATPase